MITALKVRPIDVVLAPLRWLERSRGWRRRLLILAYLFAGSALGVLLWRATSLSKLPDIGAPFDVEAYRKSAEVPQADDATVLYRRAADLYVPSVVTQDYNGLSKVLQGGWASSLPVHRTWVEANRPALSVWLEAAEKPSASPISGMEQAKATSLVGTIIELTRAASVEGSRLQEAGEMKAAWAWHRGVLRTIAHLRTKTASSTRMSANQLNLETTANLQRWLTADALDASLLREAIEELERLDAQVPTASDTYKAGYLEVMARIDDPDSLGPQLDSNYENTRPYFQALLFLKREPERSQRVAKLMFANWLAYCDEPRASRPPTVTDPRFPGVWYLYQPTAQAPANARVIPAQDLLNWFATTWFLFGSLQPMGFTEPAPEQERRAYADLMVAAAERLYLMENGKKPEGIEALVPRYLKAIPPSHAPAPPPAEEP